MASNSKRRMFASSPLAKSQSSQFNLHVLKKDNDDNDSVSVSKSISDKNPLLLQKDEPLFPPKKELTLYDRRHSLMEERARNLEREKQEYMQGQIQNMQDQGQNMQGQGQDQEFQETTYDGLKKTSYKQQQESIPIPKTQSQYQAQPQVQARLQAQAQAQSVKLLLKDKIELNSNLLKPFYTLSGFAQVQNNHIWDDKVYLFESIPEESDWLQWPKLAKTHAMHNEWIQIILPGFELNGFQWFLVQSIDSDSGQVEYLYCPRYDSRQTLLISNFSSLPKFDSNVSILEGKV